MRSVLLVLAVLVAGSVQADQLATIVHADLRFQVTHTAPWTNRIWVQHQEQLGWNLYFNELGVAFEVGNYTLRLLNSEATGADLRLYAPGYDGYGGIFSGQLDDPVGVHVYSEGRVTVERMLPLPQSDPPYTRATWTADTLDRQESEAGYLTTNLTITGRYYIAVPEPSTFVLAAICLLLPLRYRGWLM